MKKIFLGLMACAALCACTNDDLVSLGNETQKVFEGDVAYMTVSIKDVNSATRATEGSYQPGSEAEYAVSDAYFYFYDDAGVFVSEAEVWDGGQATTAGDDDYPNVEFNGQTVIILKGLTQKNYPNYVVTVLNRPEGFTPGETLDEMAALLADASAVGISQGTTTAGALTNFTMSTSSYVANANGATDDRLAYFATPIPEDAFYTEPIAADLSSITPVDIYVERLAVKVEVDVSEDLAATAIEITDADEETHNVYKLEETIAGDPNVEDEVQGEEYGDGIGAEDIYVEIIGWGLNATAKYSNIVKEIDASWTNTGATDLGTGWSWNVPDDYRSYWGKSFNYGLTPAEGYPTESGGASNAAGSTYDGTMLNEYLDYVSYNDLTLTTGASTYCAENTNTATGTTTGGIISNKSSSAITSVLIAAKIWGVDEEGTASALDLVRYNGELFTKTQYPNYVLDYLTATSQLNAWAQSTVGTETVYTQITVDDVELTDMGDGYVAVELTEAAKEKSWYSKGDNDEYTESSATAIAAVFTSFNETANANAYEGGLMYYNIPIEHLNNTTGTDSEGMPIIYEANYGVVRNHWYRLTITDLENLGVGVYNPNEVIIPSPEVPTYYIGADIHILSWKLVDQSVSL